MSKSSNRYMIGEQECYVTFDDERDDTCLLQIGNKFFRVSVRLIKILAKPAP